MDMPPAPAQDSAGARSRLTLAWILLYERADAVSGGLLLGMMIFSPWAFGATQPWSVWTMNLCGYAVTLLLGLKVFIRHGLGHKAPRWNGVRDSGITRVLVFVTILVLGYCATAALNARADYDPVQFTFRYRNYLSWLPHSYDRAATWSLFGSMLAWAGAFWALRDWLLGMTPNESRRARGEAASAAAGTGVPDRVRLMLWILSINGVLLAIEGIVQRLEGSGNLLFLVKPRVNPGAESQFGPFAYRSNAAQYLNLVWPVTLGFWWWLQRSSGRTRGAARHSLLACAAVMAAAPIISTSRAGALTSMALLAVAVGILFSGKRTDGLAKLAVFGVFMIALALGVYLGWQSLNPRLAEMGEGYRLRELMFDTARIIARENPVFGAGPGTFEHVFQIYRQSTEEYWPAQLHNDWLELRLTFGWVGFGMILVALGLAAAHPLQGRGIPASRRFVWLTWLALAGCLLQARWDFPFRVYSVIFLFLALCAVLTTLAQGGTRKS